MLFEHGMRIENKYSKIVEHIKMPVEKINRHLSDMSCILPLHQQQALHTAGRQTQGAGEAFFLCSQPGRRNLNAVLAQNMGSRSSAAPVSSARILGITASFLIMETLK